MCSIFISFTNNSFLRDLLGWFQSSILASKGFCDKHGNRLIADIMIWKDDNNSKETRTRNKSQSHVSLFNLCVSFMLHTLVSFLNPTQTSFPHFSLPCFVLDYIILLFSRLHYDFCFFSFLTSWFLLSVICFVTQALLLTWLSLTCNSLLYLSFRLSSLSFGKMMMPLNRLFFLC